MSKEGAAPISEKDSEKIIDARMAKIIYDQINSYERILVNEMDIQGKLEVQPSKEVTAKTAEDIKNKFRHQVRENLANLIANDEQVKKLDPFVLEDYLQDRDTHVKRMLGTNLDFSGNKEELAAKMNALRQQVEKSTGVAEQKPQEQVEKSKSARVSSEESWNIIADAVHEVAKTKITEAEEKVRKR